MKREEIDVTVEQVENLLGKAGAYYVAKRVWGFQVYFHSGIEVIVDLDKSRTDNQVEVQCSLQTEEASKLAMFINDLKYVEEIKALIDG